MRTCAIVALCVATLSCGGSDSEGGPGGGGGSRGPAWTFDLGASGRTAIALSADGSRVLAAAGRKLALLRSDGTVVWEASAPDDLTVTSAALSSDGTRGVVGLNGRVVAVGEAGVAWMTEAAVPNPYGGLTWAGDQVAISDGGVIVAGSAHLMRVSGPEAVDWAFEFRSGGAVAISADGSRVALDDHTNGEVVAVDGASGEVAGTWARTDLIDAIAVSADGSTIAAVGYAGVDVLDGSANHLWNFAPISHPQTHAVGLSADGSRIVSGGEDAQVRLFERGSPTPLWTYDQHSGEIFGVALSADGSTVASTGDWGAVSLIDAASGEPIWEYRPDAGEGVSQVAISDDGSRLAVGTYGGVLFFAR